MRTAAAQRRDHTLRSTVRAVSRASAGLLFSLAFCSCKPFHWEKPMPTLDVGYAAEYESLPEPEIMQEDSLLNTLAWVNGPSCWLSKWDEYIKYPRGLNAKGRFQYCMRFRNDYRAKLLNRLFELKEWSPRARQAIQAEQLFVGMSDQQVKASWGNPSDIKRGRGQWGVQENWAYPRGPQLFFRNGQLLRID